MTRNPTLYQLQSQWDSEHERKQIKFARRCVRQQTANLGRDIVISLLIFLAIVAVYVATPGFTMVSP